MSNLPTLWQYSFSHYNEKARWALDHKRVAHRRRSLVPGGPRALVFAARGTLPALDLDGERILDSTRIIAALERRDSERPLYPQDARDRERALELEEFFDEQLGHELRRVAFYDCDSSDLGALVTTAQPRLIAAPFRFAMPIGMAWARRRYRIYPPDVEESRAKVVAAMDRVEAELGGREHLVGDGFSVADLTVASLLFPLAWPEGLQYDPPRPRRWQFRDALADRPALEWVREVYRRHRPPSVAVSG